MKKRIVSILLVVLLLLSLSTTASASACVNTTIGKFGAYTHTNQLEAGEGLTGYDKADMVDFIAINSYIRVEQTGTNVKVFYDDAYIGPEGKAYLLKCFFYKAGQNVFKVTINPAIQVGQCASFNLPENILVKVGKTLTYKAQDISHIATFDQCFQEPQDEVFYRSETGWAYGPYKLNELEGIQANKWGWYMPTPIETTSYPIYAGAGQNDINRGTLVGYVTVSVENGKYVATYIEEGQHKIDNMHFGVYNSNAELAETNGAPGRFTNNVDAGADQFMAIHFNVRVTVTP